MIQDVGDGNFSLGLSYENIDKIWIDESASYIEQLPSVNTGGDHQSLGVNWFLGTSDYMRTGIRMSDMNLMVRTQADFKNKHFTMTVTVKYTKR